MRAVRAAGFVTVAESRAFVVLERAQRTATIRRIAQFDEPTFHAALRTLGIDRTTSLNALAREPIRADVIRAQDPPAD
jgi:hypothetical protein